MEKYYLANLALSSGPNVDLKRKIKLVEIHYARRPPSFGLVHFTREQSEQKGATIQLATLELSDNNVAQFCSTRRVEFGGHTSAGPCLVDFDSSKALMLEGGGSAVSCIALSQDGNLFDVQLIGGTTTSITSGCGSLKSRLSEGQFVQCRLQPASDGPSSAQHPLVNEDECYVHLLAEKAYSLHKLSHGLKLQLIHKYSIAPQEWSFRHLKRMHAMETNPRVVIVELNDSSLRIIQNAKCLQTLDLSQQLGPDQRHFIATGGSSDESTLMSYGRSQIIAHGLLTASNSRLQLTDRDPDKLLPKEPSFELDKCWYLDLNDIDSIRSLNEEEDELDGGERARGCLCPMWSASQLNPDESVAKFLVVAHKLHLLIYSFEQQPSLPFSVVYDKSFLKVAPLDGGGTKTQLRTAQATSQLDYVDPRVRPRLVHNFKLVGAQPSDALFNGIFLSPDAHLIDCRHFAQLGLLIAITGSGDLLAFRCVSSQVTIQRNSLYQQLVADSIRGTSLLTAQIDLMQSSNRVLRDDLASLESRSVANKQSQQDLDRFLRTELKVRDEIGCLYNLSTTLSNLIQVTRVVVLSTFNCFMLKPPNQSIKSVYLDNGTTTRTADNTPSPVLLANINSPELAGTERELFSGKGSGEEMICNFAILELNGGSQQKTQIDLPIFILDGQYGNLRVYYVLKGPRETLHPESVVRSHMTSFNGSQASKEDSQRETILRAHSVSLPVKGLMSYRSTVQVCAPRDMLMSCQFTGEFTRRRMTDWLDGCFHTTFESDHFEGRFSSAFTHCSIECNINENQATMLSDDLIALELVKKQVLKRATDDSIKLEIAHPLPTLRHLRHLIGLQLTNLTTANRLSSLAVVSESLENGEDVDLLLENLVSELNMCELPIDFESTAESLEDSIRDDIRSLKLPRNHYKIENRESGVSSSELNDIVCGFIIDALVDFDKLHGLKPSSDLMVSMRARLIEILIGIQKIDKSSFCDMILSNWNDIKTTTLNNP